MASTKDLPRVAVSLYCIGMDLGPRRFSKLWDWPLNGSDGLIIVRNNTASFEADLEIPTFRASEIEVRICY